VESSSLTDVRRTYMDGGRDLGSIHYFFQVGDLLVFIGRHLILSHAVAFISVFRLDHSRGSAVGRCCIKSVPWVLRRF
jgi:hypothetical protein